MQLGNGPERLRSALKDLKIQWNRTTGSWTDLVRRDYQKSHLDPLCAQTISTAKEMEKLQQVLRQAWQACE